MRTILLGIILVLSFHGYSATNDTNTNKNTMEEKIWILEENYFSNLYKANYKGVLALVDDEFLGWPSVLTQPIGKDESAHFMKKLVPKPVECKLRIERAGIRVWGDVALTHYTIHVNYTDTTGVMKTQSSRITHTWKKEADSWKLVGGMSYEK
jgi:ketosteroid isomerase-like protein